MKKFIFMLLLALLAVSIAACSEEEAISENAAVKEVATTAGQEKLETGEITLMHVHGLGYKGDGTGLYVPSHDGLKMFEQGVWKEAAAEPHDYMGFSMVDDGFYSSGHPGPGSSLENPFGVVKTTDMGQTLKMLDLYEEVDFHGMAVGYKSHAIYVINPQPNSRMNEMGLYYSTDDTKSWTKSEMAGLQGPIYSIAVHPANEAVVALGTEKGVFLSDDFGQTFETVSDSRTTAVAFSAAGALLAGNAADEVTLTTFDSKTNETQVISIPLLHGENAISYISVNPQDEKKIAFSTAEKDIYVTKDSGENWSQIAEKGIGINLESGIKK